jgi:hypothetical protein
LWHRLSPTVTKESCGVFVRFSAVRRFRGASGAYVSFHPVSMGPPNVRLTLRVEA